RQSAELRGLSLGAFRFFPRLHTHLNCHPDPEDAVFRGLRRRDLLFRFGISVGAGLVYPEPSRRAPPALVRGGLGLLRRLDADEAAVAAPVLKLHKSRDHSEQRVVTTAPDVFAGLVFGCPLPHQNRAGIDELSAEALHAQPLPLGIAAVG